MQRIASGVTGGLSQGENLAEDGLLATVGDALDRTQKNVEN